MPAAPEAPAAPAPGANAPTKGEMTIPEVPSMGAQGVKPAPAGTIPPPLRPFSENPNSAMSKVKERLRNKAQNTVSQPNAPATPAPEKKEAPALEAAKPGEKRDTPAPAPADKDDDFMGGEEPDEPEAPEEKTDDKTPSTTKAGEDKTKKEKVNPWKLLEEHKQARAKAEQELVEARKLASNPEQRKAELEEITALKKRNEELEKHIRFVDYQKSDEFITKYEKPYKDQWKASMRDLRGVTVETDDGARDISANDLVELVNMTTIQARQAARDMFGDFADDVMAERNKIRAAWDAQQNALEEAKTKGVAAGDQAMRANKEQFEKITGDVRSYYDTASQTLLKDTRHAEFITQKDGDSKHNEILTKSMQFVDEAFRANPMDPSLSEKERQTIVKKHAALRYRAVGYGIARHQLMLERAAHAETKRKLAEYEGTVPNRGGSETQAAPAVGGGSAMARMQARLRARAK